MEKQIYLSKTKLCKPKEGAERLKSGFWQQKSQIENARMGIIDDLR